MKKDRFDVVVIGGGHAGYEAALASARMGCDTALVTFKKEKIAEMSCNPSIGGLAKGHIVREIDALGGEMGKAIDATGIQFRILNKKKGPAVQAPRAQADKEKYREYFIDLLEKTENLTLVFGEASDINTEGNKVTGITLASGETLIAEALIITTGTFMNGLIHIGAERTNAGRLGDPPSSHLSGSLKKLGLELGRLKTGTPARLDIDSVDFSEAVIQPGDEPPPAFSFQTELLQLDQVPCWLTYTSDKTHEIIRNNIHLSPLYSGIIVGIGPRYCPSLEDKVQKFPERVRHQVFLEPEGRNSNLIYPNGISSSLPRDVQEDFIHSIPALRNAKIILPGYAIEYDFLFPRQLKPTLESKSIENLYFAGQVNGTSGYEEAGAQGLMAGINAVLKIRGREPLILLRDQAYIGVMIDDLVTRDIDEPYRMFTSRAEYRLLLRCDNADKRLMKIGVDIGLLPRDVYEKSIRKYQIVDELISLLSQKAIVESDLSEKEIQDYLTKNPSGRISVASLIKRPEYNASDLLSRFLPDICDKYTDETISLAELEIKYSGYVDLQARAAERVRKLEKRRIPDDFNFIGIPGLSRESQDKLNRFRPSTLGQASRISGLTPASIAALNVALEKYRNER
ncbi:MAG: tRNA uridine-5-carboxymethylaminomethyl(34) synthesis enzyme MnmG [Acidobacteria bacterium]|nr:tRNA uridine-5-carboxymethylaminomethyl(34) synthesis enzyme MnmG [Acidobacteriota bacterium]